MYSPTSPSSWNTFFHEFRCRRCGSDAGYESRPRNFVEKFLAPILLLRTVRCGGCYGRSFRPMSVPLLKKRKPMVVDHEQAMASLDSAIRKEPGKETSDSSTTRARIA